MQYSFPRRFPLGLISLAVLAGAASLGGSTGSVEKLLHPIAATAAARIAQEQLPVAVPTGTQVSNPLSTIGVPSAVKATVGAVTGIDLEKKIKWVEVRHGKDHVKTPDAVSRLLLVQAAAQRAGLQQVGLNYADVYGLINAETSWLPRTGVGKTGTHSYGLAQFEPGTAKALGLTDPDDPVQAVYAAAMHMKTAAAWAADKLQPLKLPPEIYAQKLREGVSVYYNLSWKGRKAWDGTNTATLPVATQRHISNTRLGAERAEVLAEKFSADIEG